jgi:hypothetical protein
MWGRTKVKKSNYDRLPLRPGASTFGTTGIVHPAARSTAPWTFSSPGHGTLFLAAAAARLRTEIHSEHTSLDHAKATYEKGLPIATLPRNVQAGGVTVWYDRIRAGDPYAEQAVAFGMARGRDELNKLQRQMRRRRRRRRRSDVPKSTPVAKSNTVGDPVDDAKGDAKSDANEAVLIVSNTLPVVFAHEGEPHPILFAKRLGIGLPMSWNAAPTHPAEPARAATHTELAQGIQLADAQVQWIAWLAEAEHLTNSRSPRR